MAQYTSAVAPQSSPLMSIIAPELAPQQAQLTRQQQMAALLRQQSLENDDKTESIGGWAIKKSPLAALGKLAQALGANYMNDQNDTAQTALNKASSEALVRALGGGDSASGATTEAPVPMGPTNAAASRMDSLTSAGASPESASSAAFTPTPAPEQIPQQNPSNSFGLANLIRGNAIQSVGGNSAGTAYWDQFKTSPEAIRARELGLTLGQQQKDAAAIQTQKSYIAPFTVAPGASAFKPNETRPFFNAPIDGMQLTFDQNGKATSSNVPNYVEGLADKSKATASGPAQFDMVTVDTPQGKKMMTKAQAAEFSNGNSSTPSTSSANKNPVASRPEDSDKAMIYKDEIAKAKDKIANPAKYMSPDELAKDPSMSDFKTRAQSDLNGLTRLTKGMPGIDIQSEGSQRYNTERAKDFATAAAEYQKSGRSAGSMNRNFDALETIYKDPKIAKGGAAETISSLKNMANSFGVDIKGLGGEQAAMAITNKMALDLRSTADGGGMPGSMSDQDRNFLKALTPGLEKSPEGRQRIIDTGRKVAQRQMDVAKMANAYEMKHGQIDIGFDRELQEFSEKTPLFNKPSASALPPNFANAIAAEYARRQKGK